MTTQAIQLNTAYTGPITFTDINGNPTTGPSTGTVALDNQGNGTVSLSADGQSINVTATTLPITITYSATNSAGVALTGPALTLTQAAPGSTATAFDFGPLVPGTTA